VEEAARRLREVAADTRAPLDNDAPDRWIGWLSVVIASLYLLGFIRVPNIHNEFLALPIARELAFPGTYAASDLVVSSGARAPFHVYHAAQWLYVHGLDVDLWWLAAFVVATVACFAAALRLARALGLPYAVAGVAVVLLAVARGHHLTIHDSGIPLQSFMSASVSLPLVFLSAADAIARRWDRGAILAGAAFLFHPGLGVISLSVVAVLALAGAARPPAARAARALAMGVVVTLPNVIYLVAQAPENFSDGLGPEATQVFRRIAQHAFADVARAGGYGIVALGAALAWIGGRAFSHDPRSPVRLCITWLVAIVVVFTTVVTLYPERGIVQFYAGRATWLLKPLVLVFLAAHLTGWIASAAANHRPSRAGAAIWVLALLYPNPLVANGLALAGTAVLVAAADASRRGYAAAAAVLGVGAGTIMLARAPGDFVATDTLMLWQNLGMIGIAVALVVGPGRHAVMTLASHSIPPRAAAGLIGAIVAVAVVVANPAGRRWLPALPSEVLARARFSQPSGEEAPLFEWIRDSTPARSVVAAPPFEDRFLPLEHVSVRSVYVSSAILAQLTYDVAAFREGARRLAVMGVRGADFDPRVYSRLDSAEAVGMARDGVSFAIVSRQTGLRWADRLPVPYRHGQWAVVDLRPLKNSF
jgi:hypothetical protein